MQKPILSGLFIIVLFNLLTGLVWHEILWLLPITGLCLLIGLYDASQTHHSILINYPFIGRGRWIVEELRPFIQQYLIESETDGKPISRMYRSIVYQRAKGDVDSSPYGTQLDTYANGYEWIGHSLSAMGIQEMDRNPRVIVGGKDCTQPYSASVLNISAMSFGALSSNAIEALNKGAAKGEFYHNTGEGGLTPYHLDNGGDIVWQIGTGYFGCRNSDGTFNADKFAEKARHPNVKMIEIKLSQGAKPGHGGILPAHKNTLEIAAVRGVEPGTQVDSPPRHSAFTTPIEMMEYIRELRTLSEGKPVGFKLSLGRKSEFVAICKAMVQTGIKPDFITVDGGEGGTGAAPLEYANSIGFPLREAVAFVEDCLIGFDLREDIKLIASGKVITAFDIVKNLSVGADICNSARGMMLALGCVQSLSCHTNRCPTGVATQDPSLAKGLVVEDKYQRVARFHRKTVKAFMDILSSTGHGSPSSLNRTHIFRRVSQAEIKRYDDIFPLVKRGSFLTDNIAEAFKLHVKEGSARSFMPASHLAKIEEDTKAV